MSTAKGVLYLLVGTLATLLLQWVAAALGPFGILVNLSAPLPAAFVVMCAGPLIGAGVVGMVALALLADAGAATAAAYLLQFGLASLALPFLLRRGWSWDRAVAGTLAVVMGVSLIALAGYAASRDLALTDLVGRYIQDEVDAALAIYREADIPEAQLAELGAVVRRVADLLHGAWPALVTVANGAVLLFAVLFLSAVSGGRYALSGVPFRMWKAPELLVWPLILAGFVMLFAGGTLQLVAMNLLAILLPLYFLQGLAVLAHFFWKRGTPPFLRGLGYLLVAALNPMPLVVTGVGVFDLWADFRKPRIKNKT